MTKEQKIYVAPPQAPCDECIENARHLDENVGFIWCGHTRYGGIYHPVTALWNVMGPFDDEACFKRVVYTALTPRA